MWFIIGWYLNNWYKVKDNHNICTVDQLKEAHEGPSSQSTILYQEPRLIEVGIVLSRVEEVGFWKTDFRHCVYFTSVR